MQETNPRFHPSLLLDTTGEALRAACDRNHRKVLTGGLIGSDILIILAPGANVALENPQLCILVMISPQTGRLYARDQQEREQIMEILGG